MPDTPNMPVVLLRDVHQRRRIFTIWEKQRDRQEVSWAVECFAEMLGVFFLVFSGVGAQVNWVLGNITGRPNSSSVFQIGFSWACGVIFALTVCGATSGAHINPCVTIAFVVFRGFPTLRAVRYIIAQILGGFIACLLIYAQYKVMIDDATAILAKAGTLETLQFTPSGPAGAFAVYLPPGQLLGRAFLNEFITDAFLGIIIWAALDPSNILVPPPFAPVVIALAYGTANWDFSEPGLAANTARDLGARLMAMAVWGVKAAGGRYSAVAALTNIPATLVGVGIYEFFLTDCERVLPQASLEHKHILTNYGRNGEKRANDVPDLEKQMDIHSPVVDDLAKD